jgi:hypothetical protein
MRRVMICLICLVCVSFVLQVQAQDDHYGRLAVRFLRAYLSVQDQTQPSNVLPIAMADDFVTETIFCSETPPTEFEIIPLDEKYPDSDWFTHLRHLRTDQGNLYVVFSEFEYRGVVEVVVQHVICEDSPAGQALKAVVTAEISCGMAPPSQLWIQGHWTNREGDRALVRIQATDPDKDMFIYLKKEGEVWAFDEGWCAYDDPPGQALNLVTEYMYNYRDPFYFVGSVDVPVFAEITSVRGNLDQMTVLIQIETQNERKDEQDDPVCMLKMRGSHDLVMVIYEMRCVSE